MATKKKAKKKRPPLKPKKYVAGPDELVNDPSLRWCPYRMWETVWSDVHQAELRFVRYEGERVVLATLGGMAELPGTVGKLQVRRLTTMH